MSLTLSKARLKAALTLAGTAALDIRKRGGNPQPLLVAIQKAIEETETQLREVARKPNPEVTP